MHWPRVTLRFVSARKKTDCVGYVTWGTPMSATHASIVVLPGPGVQGTVRL